jgi:hypothetical protein
MEDFTAFIGRAMIPREEGTNRLYELEEEVQDCLKRAAQELQRFQATALPEEDAIRFSIAGELFVLLDRFRPESVQAATAFLRRFGMQVTGTAVPSTSSTPKASL